jgi:hypothetical protein
VQKGSKHTDSELTSGMCCCLLFFPFPAILICHSSSIWFEELQQVKAIRPTAASGQNTVLQQFFWRLVQLLSLPVLVHFVFEGADISKTCPI